MNPETLMMLCDALDNASKEVLWLFVIIFGATVAVLLPALFLAPAFHRWLMRTSWNSAIVSTEKKALR